MDGVMGTAPDLSEVPGWKSLFSAGVWRKSVVLAGGVALHAINLYMILTLLPSAVHDIGGLQFYAWNETLFIVASIIGSALSVRAMGLLGPRLSYGLASCVFALGAILCAMAPSMTVLICGRIVQGLGAGLLVSLAYGLIGLVFPEAMWTRAMGLLSSMWGIATLCGPALGGVFAEMGAWREAFWFVCAASMLFSIVAMRVLPAHAARNDEDTSRIAWTQLALLVLSVVILSVVSAVTRLDYDLAGLVLTTCLIVWFVRCENGGERRLLPRGALNFHSSLMLLYGLLSGLALTVEVIEIFAPLFLQLLHHQRPLIAGYLSALMAAGWSVASISCAAISQKGARRVVLGAPWLALASIVFLAWWMPVPVEGAVIDIVAIAMAFFAVGAGVGMAWPHVLSAILRLTDPGEQGLASASLTTVQLYTTALAAALAGTIANAAGLAHPGGLDGAKSAALWVFALFSVVPLLSIRLSRSAIFRHRVLGP